MAQTCSFRTMILISWYLIIIESFLWYVYVSFEISSYAHIKSIFEEHGIPNKFVRGNDTQFTSSSFTEFSKAYGFEHVTASPYYSQANGFIERNVQKVKNLLQKFKKSGSCYALSVCKHHLSTTTCLHPHKC